MSVMGKYEPLGESLTPFSVDTSQTKKGKGKVEIKGPGGILISVAAKHIKQTSSTKGTVSLGKKTVHLTAEDSNHRLVKMKVKIEDFAKALGVTSNQLIDAGKKGKLEDFISQQFISTEWGLGGESYGPVEKTTVHGLKEKSLASTRAEETVKTTPSEREVKATPFLDPEIKKELLKNAASMAFRSWN